MKSLIEQEQKSIKGLWEQPLYIPIYQREFVWEDEQIENAVRTILEDKEAGIEAYMGNILLVKKQKDGVDCSEIVDGQQRMTFAFLLMKSIHDLITEFKENIDPEENPDFFMDTINSTLRGAKSLLTIENKEERLSGGHYPRIFYASEKLNKNITSLLNGIIEGVPTPDGRATIIKIQKKLKNLIASKIIDPENPSMKSYKKTKEENESKVIIRKLKEIFDYISNNVKYIEIKLTEEKYATEIFERMNSTSKPLTDYELFKNYIAGQLIQIKDKNVEQSITELDDLVNFEQNKLDTNSIIRSLLYLKEGRVTSSKYKFDKLKKIYSNLHNPKKMFEEVKNLIQTYRNLEDLSVDKNEEDILLPYLIIKTFNLKQLRPAIIAMVIKHGYTDEMVKLFMLLISIIFKRIVFDGDVANIIESLLYQTFQNDNEELAKPKEIIEKIKAKDWYKDVKDMEINQKSFDSIKKNEFIKILWIYSVNKNFGSINTLVNSAKSEITINFSGSHVEHILPRSWEDNWSDIVGKMENNERAELIDNPGNKIPILGEYNIKASNKSYKDKKTNHYVLSSFNDIKPKDLNSQDKWVISTGLHTDFISKNNIWNEKIIKERAVKLKEDFEIEINKWLV